MKTDETKLQENWKEFRELFNLPSKPSLLVVGLAKTGISLCNFLMQFQVNIIGTDNNKINLAQYPDLLDDEKIRFEIGFHSEETFSSVDMIFVSPGVPLSTSFFSSARKLGIPIINDIELFSHFYGGSITAITGSNGKSTVTTLIGSILKRASFSVEVAGNIGKPVIDKEFLKFTSPENLILELSSFQLEAIRYFAPNISILLNLTPDHQNRYVNNDNYYQAKFNLFKLQKKYQWAVLNYDDFEIRARESQIKAQKCWFSRMNTLNKGVWLENNKIFAQLPSFDGLVCSLDDVKLQGEHNIENILAAVAASLLHAVDVKIIQEELASFSGLAHRFEMVGIVKERIFINDSKATNVGAVNSALQSYSKNVHLIMGGRNKGGDFCSLKSQIQEKVCSVYVIGEAQQEIQRCFFDIVEVYKCDNLATALWKSYRNSKAGDTILLSPACASFDMYKNFEERGEHFCELVLDLIHVEESNVETVTI